MNLQEEPSLAEQECPLVSQNGHQVFDLVEWARGRGKILIVTHDNPDPDSIASAVALRHLFLVKTGQDAVLTYGGVIGRSENRNMVNLLEIPLVPIADVKIDQFAIVCMVDTQPQTGNNSFPTGYPVHLVIDHHQPKRDLNDVCWVDIREHYGASATILYEYLTLLQVSINTRLATSLFYAIKSETQDLGREWSKADREAYLKLLPLSNNRILYDIIHPRVSRNYFAAFRTALDNACLYGNALVFNLLKVESPDLVAELADFLLRQEGIEYVLGMGWFNGDEILSMRTVNAEARLGSVIQKMVEGIGTAGGHGMIAGGQIRQTSAALEDQKKLQQLLTEKMLSALNIPTCHPQPLIANDAGTLTD